jgi:hypothetical protein
LAYFALGGNASAYEVDAYLNGLMVMSAHEHNVLAQAVNERLAEICQLSVYRPLGEPAAE